NFKKRTVTIEVSDGDNTTVTRIKIVNPDDPSDEGGLPGPSALLMVMAMFGAGLVVLRVRRRG
ncbi:MAG: hypothetical protein KAS77_10510, partial [Thermoplasmata archaeon]|nr:hypothetical protein [Thermoplasmata archaeon]